MWIPEGVIGSCASERCCEAEYFHACKLRRIGLLASQVAVQPFENCSIDQSRFLTAVSTKLFAHLRLERCTLTEPSIVAYYEKILCRYWDAAPNTLVQDVFYSSNKALNFILMDNACTIYSFERGGGNGLKSVTMPNGGLATRQWFRVTKFTLNQATAKWKLWNCSWSGPCLRVQVESPDGSVESEEWCWGTDQRRADRSIRMLRLGQSETGSETGSENIENNKRFKTTALENPRSEGGSTKLDIDWCKMQSSRSQNQFEHTARYFQLNEDNLKKFELFQKYNGVSKEPKPRPGTSMLVNWAR
ncbi:hypothetical protein BJ508DRAFT_311071 [Ascobolus immersus RN42]|uniref:Uncharacterized protein n=1 Tax=Ascobolus immersus RN42 TaxID=1160509 RepID=A0A3N4HTU1_ASCIM|nr:hypothetical protein BJ508DRAFT_311071 [Ascobolus immersus RN42]